MPEPTVIPLFSPSFPPGQAIPKRHTADGPDLSPPLRWGEPPPGTRSLALLCEDPDAAPGSFCHWAVYHVPPTLRGIAEGLVPSAALPNGSAQGTNDFNRSGYGGPCPAPGERRRYYFHLFALDVWPELRPGATGEQLLSQIRGHVLGKGELMGTYAREEAPSPPCRPGESTPPRWRRGAFVVASLLALCGGGLLLVALLLCGWFLLAIPAALATLAAVTSLHHLSWGRSLRCTAGGDLEDLWVRREGLLPLRGSPARRADVTGVN